jgi:hypothetical protein
VTRNLRVAINALAQQGLRVVRVSNGRKHRMLHLADGRRIPMSRGSSVDKNFAKIQRDQARRLAQQSLKASDRVQLPFSNT